MGGDVIEVGGKIAMMPIKLGTADFMVHHIHAFTIHVTVLILLKGVLYARSSKLIPDKSNLGFRFPCDGPGRGGTCQSSSWDHVFLGLFWMYNSISVVLFHTLQVETLHKVRLQLMDGYVTSYGHKLLK